MSEQEKSPPAQDKPRKSKVDLWIKIGFVLAAIGIAIFITRRQRSFDVGHWGRDFPAAMQQARQENRRVVVLFLRNPVGPLEHRVRNIILKPENVRAFRDGHFIGVLVQSPENLDSELAVQYGIEGLPTLLLLDPNGAELDRRGDDVGETDFRGGFLAEDDPNRPPSGG